MFTSRPFNEPLFAAKSLIWVPIWFKMTIKHVLNGLRCPDLYSLLMLIQTRSE